MTGLIANIEEAELTLAAILDSDVYWSATNRENYDALARAYAVLRFEPFKAKRKEYPYSDLEF